MTYIYCQMTNNQTISWIFLATALASQQKPATIKDISKIADGIYHAVPKEKEMKASLSFLIENGWIEKKNSTYQLTKKGMINYNFASLKTDLLLNIWKNIEKMF